MLVQSPYKPLLFIYPYNHHLYTSLYFILFYGLLAHIKYINQI